MRVKEQYMVKISVIIPIYNSGQYLSRCLNSVLNQTFQSMEIILVDDGSKDDSLNICKRYALEDERIIVLHQENGGSTKARKLGLEVSQGEYIAFVDSDDWIEACLLENLYKLTEKGQADIVASGCSIEQDGEVIKAGNRFEEGFYDKKNLEEQVYPRMLYFEGTGLFQFGILQYMWGKLFKRDVIEPCLNNLDERIFDGEDVACVFDTCLRASAIVIDNHPYYHYMRRDDSICTGKRDERYFVNAVHLHHYMEQVFLDSSYPEIMLLQLKYFMNSFINNGTLDIFGYGYEKSNVAGWWSLPPIPADKKYKIAIFSAGNVGQSYYKQLKQLDNVEVVLWVDNYKYGNKIEGMMITHPDSLKEIFWDYVLVAVKKRKIADEIRGCLLECGVTERKILYQEPERKSELYKFYIKE